MRERPITNIRLHCLEAETADIGKDAYLPVCDDYDPWDNAFTCTIHTVKIAHRN